MIGTKSMWYVSSELLDTLVEFLSKGFGVTVNLRETDAEVGRFLLGDAFFQIAKTDGAVYKINSGSTKELQHLKECFETHLYGLSLKQDPEPNFGRNCLTREDMYKLFPKGSIGVELGVFKGSNAEQLLNITKPHKLYLVDRWDWEKSPDADSWFQETGEETYNGVLARFEGRTNVEIVRSYSVPFLKSLPNESLNWVYIDSDHGYEVTRDELALLKDKVVPGGLITGHDFCDEPWGVGVKKAVYEFCQLYGWQIVLLTEEHIASFLLREKKYPMVWRVE
jgi:hypothetical protein